MSDEKVLDRIKKCLALAESRNPNEAATAIKMAQRLMNKHNLEHFDVMVKRKTSSVKLNMKLQKHVDLLIRYIGSAFGCDIIYESESTNVNLWNEMYQCYQLRLRFHQKVSFIGTEHAATVAMYAFENLHRLMTDARKEFMGSLHGNSRRKTKTEKSDAFALGWVMAVGRNLPQMDVAQNVIADTQAYIDKHFGSLEIVHVRPMDEDKMMDQMISGYQTGLHVNVHTGVDGSAESESNPALLETYSKTTENNSHREVNI